MGILKGFKQGNEEYNNFHDRHDIGLEIRERVHGGVKLAPHERFEIPDVRAERVHQVGG